jgi:4-amino-4-deoxy-L-arabinose transferase-like glycosyltransferase
MLDGIVKGRSPNEPAPLGGILKAAVALIAVCSLSLALRPAMGVVDRPVVEDAFYCYTVSYNLAHGKGITIDGSTLTNGFQPLFVFVCVPLFALAGNHKVLAIRLVFVFEWALYMATALFLAQIVRDFIASDDDRASSLIPWLTAALYLSAALVFLQHFNGLETGCLLFFYAATWRYYQASLRDSHRHYLALGLLLGLLVLARIDAVFFVLILCVNELLSRRKLRFRERAVRFLELSFPSFLVSSPWWVYNLVEFHSLMPTSGRAEQAWGLSAMRWRIIVVAFERALAPWIYSSESHLDWTAGTAVRSLLLLGVIVMGIRFRRQLVESFCRYTSASEESRRALEFVGCLAVSLIVLAFWYVLSSWATHCYTRYLAPLGLVGVFLLAFAGAQLYRRIPAFVSVGASVLLVIPILVGTVILWRANTFFAGSPMLRQQLKLVTKYVPPNDVVAAGQSGTLGYFRSNVVNLDGKVNADAFGYQSRMREYLPKVQAQWLCDWPSYVRGYLGDHPEEYGWRLVAREGEFVLYHQDATRAGR